MQNELDTEVNNHVHEHVQRRGKQLWPRTFVPKSKKILQRRMEAGQKNKEVSLAGFLLANLG